MDEPSDGRETGEGAGPRDEPKPNDASGRYSRRRLLKMTSLGVAGGALATPAAAGSRSRTLTLASAGGDFGYAFSVSGSLEKSHANGASINSDDTITGSAVTGQGVGGGADSYSFTGEIESFQYSGSIRATVDGHRVYASHYPDNVISIEATGPNANYELSVSGHLEKTTANGGSVNDTDTITGSTASGSVINTGVDSYVFEGEIESLSYDDHVRITRNGDRIYGSHYPDNVLSIEGNGPYASYTFSVTENLGKSAANGASFDAGDGVSGTSGSGSVTSGTDSYTFEGKLVDFDLDGDATVTLNGEEIDGSDRSPVVGIFNGLSDENFATVDRMESWQGEQYPVQNFFVPWNPDEGHLNWLFNHVLPTIWEAGRIPLITWEPFTPGANDASVNTQAIVEAEEYDAYIASLDDTTPDDIEERIANGQYDDYIETWAGRLHEWLAGPDGREGTDDDRRAYLRLGHEMNGNWYPWSPAVGNSSPSDYVAMWRHVHERFARSAIDPANLEWMWCVNAEDVGPNTAEQLYPGDSYVDWLSVDGYNWGTGASSFDSHWQSPNEVFDDMLGRVRNIADKPVCIAETASGSKTESGFRPNRKDGWIGDAFEYFEDEGVEMWCWFNEDKETDWAMFNGVHGTEKVGYDGDRVNAYAAYRRGVGPHSATTADASGSGTSPLTTAAFNGED